MKFIEPVPGTLHALERSLTKLGAAYGKYALAVALLLAAAGSWLLPQGVWRQFPVFTLLWFCPAIAWYAFLPGSRLQRLTSGLGLAILSNTMLALVLDLLPGPIPRPALLLAALVGVILPLILRFWQGRASTTTKDKSIEEQQLTQREGLALLLVASLLLLTLVLRLPDLGYKEFQGDEGIIMERAAAALLGDDGELFLHQKGPVEILIPLFTWSLTGSINEFWARLPFTMAGIFAVLALYLLARAWLGQAPAIVAAFLFTVNGFAVAFSRIVQYQSLVILWTILAVLHGTHFRRTGSRVHLSLAAAFLAGGLLAHYDAVMVVPVLAYLVVRRILDEHKVPWTSLVTATAIGFVLLAAFYLPFIASPSFSGTTRYLFGDRLGGSLLSWSGPDAWRMATFYNSTYYIVGLSQLGAVALWGLRRHRLYGAILAFALVPLLFYTVTVADPRTHIYTIFPGATILAAAGAHIIWRAVSSSDTRRVLSLLFVLFLAVSTIYVYLLFTDTSAERQRNWTGSGLPFYPTTWQEPPRYGLFGFPHQSGWRAAATLEHEWPYASNEEQEVTRWYMAQAPRTHCSDFETFFLASNVQDAVPYDEEELDQRYLSHVISVRGRPSLRVYQNEPTVTQEIDAGEITLWRTPQQVVPPERSGQHDVDVNLGGRARLMSYDLDASRARPGGELVVVLYWKGLQPFERNFQTFVHLYGNELYAQHDSAPDCTINPTTRWEPGRVVRDTHIIQLPEDVPTEQPIPVLVGMYDLISKDRLLRDDNGEDLIQLTTVTVEPQ